MTVIGTPVTGWGDLGYTVKQQIIDAIDTTLKTILVANDFYTDIGAHVQAWDETPLDLNLETMRLDYRDETEDRANLTGAVQSIFMTVAIRIRTAGAVAMTDMEKMVADVSRAVHADVTWGGLAEDTLQNEGIQYMKKEQADSASGAVIKYQIEYVVNRGMS